mmetsp:Transcript_29406/g.44875  ORF Transcript_29406/g.44875 Transcript_29406/m.44875 type:complete len:171 (+) Transcript_29406:92-604(+)
MRNILCFLFVLLVQTTSSFAHDIFEEVGKDSMQGIKEALKEGISINSIGPDGQTPLMHAVLRGRKNAVRFLLRKGADTTIGEKDGYTPLHGAGFQGRAEIAQMLIDHGLDPRGKHEDGHEPIERACWGSEKRHTETVGVFLKNHVPLPQSCLNSPNKATLDLIKKDNYEL